MAAVEAPAVRIAIDGAPVAGATMLTMEHVRHHAAARYEVAFAAGAGAGGLGYFSTLGTGTVQIDIAAGGAGFVPMLTGTVDNVTLDLRDGVAVVSGRDLAARLIDAAAAEIFLNRTASQIAEAIAARHGLAANVTPTSSPVGQYYELDHARTALLSFSRGGTEWNLLSELALLEGCDLSVTGQTLNFVSRTPGAAPVRVMPARSLITLSIDRALGAAGQVRVASWNARTKSAVTAGAGSGVGTTIVKPNLLPSRAARVAAALSEAAAAHAVLLEASMPGETALMPGQAIGLVGTGTELDGTYVLDAIRRRIDAGDGFVQTIRAHASAGAAR